jgi:hypothetical protein
MGPAVRPTASRSVEAKAADTAPPPKMNGVAAEDERFAPLPSPLRDLNGTASRKTLVGITPPTRPSSPPTSTALAASLDAGTPRRGVEISAVVPVHDTPAHESDSIRRPANPTVPFPRPRLLPRLPAAESDSTPLRGTGRGHTWRGQTTRTLSLVLSADRRPQRVAAVLVCAVAAIVIFVMGRSPVSGTATIGQAKNALNPDGTLAPAASTGEPAATSPESTAPPMPGASAQDPGASGGDVATDSVPTNETQTVGGSSDTPRAPNAEPRPPAPRVPAAAQPQRGFKGPVPPAAPVRAPAGPIKRSSEPAPPAGKGGEFDFGI